MPCIKEIPIIIIIIIIIITLPSLFLPETGNARPSGD
jgi:hypothetical protein